MSKARVIYTSRLSSLEDKCFIFLVAQNQKYMCMILYLHCTISLQMNIYAVKAHNYKGYLLIDEKVICQAGRDRTSANYIFVFCFL